MKSAHTALAVKACLLGCNSATLNAQVTFVYIAVAISALAGGGPLKFSHPSSAGVFVIFWTIFGRWGGFRQPKKDLGGFRQRKNGQQ